MKPTPNETHDMVDVFTIAQCRDMAQEMIAAKEDASLLPIAKFDGERVMWLITGLESHAALAKSLVLTLGEVKAELEQAQKQLKELRKIAYAMADYSCDFGAAVDEYNDWKKENPPT